MCMCVGPHKQEEEDESESDPHEGPRALRQSQISIIRSSIANTHPREALGSSQQ